MTELEAIRQRANSMIDLQAIRERNERRRGSCHGYCETTAVGEMYTTGCTEDVDALLAEIERLQTENGWLRTDNASLREVVRGGAEVFRSIADGIERDMRRDCGNSATPSKDSSST